MFTHDNTPTNTHKILNILRMMRPHRLIGGRKVRLGRFFDGGYVMIDDFAGIEAAYSIGINDDVSWDLDMAARGVPVFQYDHTIEAVPVTNPLTIWRKEGLDAVTDPARSMRSLSDMLAQNGHADSNDLILKCDIEGAELYVFPRLPADMLPRFRQIVMELHSFEALADPAFADQARETICRLTASHYVVHVHANNCARFSIIGGIPVPSVMELTFLRKDAGDFVVSDEFFPSELDMPCNPALADNYLGKFEFG